MLLLVVPSLLGSDGDDGDGSSDGDCAGRGKGVGDRRIAF